MNKFELLGELQESFNLGIMGDVLVFAKEDVPLALVDTQTRYGLHIPGAEKISKSEYKLLCKFAAKDLSALPSHVIGDTLYADPEGHREAIDPEDFLQFLAQIIQLGGEEGL